MCYISPPKCDKSTFINEFTSIYYTLFDMHKNIVFVGDFNLHINDTNDPIATRFLDSLNAMSLENNVNGKTYRHSVNTLDLVIDNYVDKLVFDTKVCFELSYSDHAIVNFTILSSIEQRKKIRKDISFPLYSIEAKGNLNSLLNESYHDFTLMKDHPTSLMKSLNDLLKTGKMKFIKFLVKTIILVEMNPWYNAEFMETKRRRRQVERKYSKNKTEYRAEYRAAVNSSVKSIKNAKQEYFEKAFADYKSNPHKTFKWVKILLGRDEAKILPDLSTENPQLFVDTQNFHDHHKLLNIRREIDKRDVSKRAVFSNPTNVIQGFRPINMKEN